MDEIERLKQEVERLTRELNYATMDEEESEEISAELFALCCAVVDGKPDAAASRDKLQEHIKHVQSCRRGSCATELGQTQKARTDAAIAERDALAERVETLTNNLNDVCEMGAQDAARVATLEAAIRDAPHGAECNEGFYRTPTGSAQAYCDCWKAAALGHDNI